MIQCLNKLNNNETRHELNGNHSLKNDGKEELKKLGIYYVAVKWGEVENIENITMKQREGD